ncbi:GNAT family N-acetyltransferase [Geodermatophilus sp. SYSU D00697]
MTTTGARTGTRSWVHDPDPRWDADRERVFATIAEVVFPTVSRTPGERLAATWWRVEDAGRVVGYGWLDDVWGDAEILLAVEEGARGTGAGAFALARLEEEAAARGLNYVVNVVRPAHPDREAVTAWFLAHGFRADEEGRLRKRVAGRSPAVGGSAGGSVDRGRQERYASARERAAARGHTYDPPGPTGDMGPGHEESGGYVDPEHHRF